MPGPAIAEHHHVMRQTGLEEGAPHTREVLGEPGIVLRDQQHVQVRTSLRGEPTDHAGVADGAADLRCNRGAPVALGEPRRVEVRGPVLGGAVERLRHLEHAGQRLREETPPAVAAGQADHHRAGHGKC
ncbi:hypothetical protein ACJ65_07100 [Kocuria rhizophila]|nr:hypothetical protein ACJ65_07100 [Kocuria rhizophila]